MKPQSASGSEFLEPLIFERGVPGRSGVSLPPLDVPAVDAAALYGDKARKEPAHLPEVSEPGVVRHFLRVSQSNFCIDSNFYPLGSCTMKHNPKVNEWAARLPGFSLPHPAAPTSTVQGCLELMWRLKNMLAEIVGLDEVSLQPAAGAQGELTGLMMMRAYHQAQGRAPKQVLIPDTAHGTNPASCTLNGLKALPIAVGPDGIISVESVAAALDKAGDDVCGVMITNPNTIGLYEEHLETIAKMVHEKGGLVYGDGANLNAILGKARPGDSGIDVLQFNLHKTFTTPHGGGGPGSGPVAFRKSLEPFQPKPVLVQLPSGGYDLDEDRPQSIGKVRSFYGNFGMFVRAYTYIRELGPEGLKAVAEMAVLNANYIAACLEEHLLLAYPRPCMHEAVFSDKDIEQETGVKTLDIAKRLIDYGYHPPTVYFPLNVRGAMMIEPTESEAKSTLDNYVETYKQIIAEAKSEPDLLKNAPTRTRLRRLDEARAARKPILRWHKGGDKLAK